MPATAPGPFQFLEVTLAEDLRDQAHVLVHEKGRARAIAGDDAGALLAAVLEREKPVVGQDGGVRMAEHAEESAFVLRKASASVGSTMSIPLAKDFQVIWRDHTK